MFTDWVQNRRRSRHRGTRRLRMLCAGGAAAALLSLGLAIHGGASGTTAHLTVHRGDTLWGIATAHYPGDSVQVRVAQLEAVNRLGSASLRPGQILTLPGP